MIMDFFRSIDDKLTTVEDYMDLRVRTGKFTEDIPVVSRFISQNTKERTAFYWNVFYKSRSTQFVLSKLHQTYNALMKIPLLENIITLLIDGARVLSWGLIELSITVTIAFFSIFFSVSLFQNSPQLFFIFLPFIFLVNLFSLSLFYLYVDKKLKHESINWLSAFNDALKHFLSLSILFFYQISLILGGIILFFIASLYYSYFFDFLSIVWGESFYYWIVVVFLAITLSLLIFLISIYFTQSFYFMLLDKRPSFQAFELSRKLYKTFPLQIFFFNFALILFTGLYGIWSISNYYYVGVGMTLAFYWLSNSYLNYLLRRKFIERTAPLNNEGLSKFKYLLMFIPFIGFSTYILSSVIIIQHYREIDSLFTVEQATKLKIFRNDDYKYSIGYPSDWSEYHTNTNSVTIYNNDTGTKVGGIWVTVTVAPLTENFDALFKSAPGLFSYETITNNVITKITNLSIQGHSAVKFTYIKNEPSFTRYQTHYLIRKNNMEYDIIFTTVNRDVEDLNTELFQEILNSFRFLDEH